MPYANKLTEKIERVWPIFLLIQTISACRSAQAVLGYVLGTYGAYLCGLMMQAVAA